MKKLYDCIRIIHYLNKKDIASVHITLNKTDGKSFEFEIIEEKHVLIRAIKKLLYNRVSRLSLKKSSVL